MSVEGVESSEDALCRPLSATSNSNPRKSNTRAAEGEGRRKVGCFMYSVGKRTRNKWSRAGRSTYMSPICRLYGHSLQSAIGSDVGGLRLLSTTAKLALPT